jgi:hypothetical protein
MIEGTEGFQQFFAAIQDAQRRKYEDSLLTELLQSDNPASVISRPMPKPGNGIFGAITNPFNPGGTFTGESPVRTNLQSILLGRKLEDPIEKRKREIGLAQSELGLTYDEAALNTMLDDGSEIPITPINSPQTTIGELAQNGLPATQNPATLKEYLTENYGSPEAFAQGTPVKPQRTQSEQDAIDISAGSVTSPEFFRPGRTQADIDASAAQVIGFRQQTGPTYQQPQFVDLRTGLAASKPTSKDDPNYKFVVPGVIAPQTDRAGTPAPRTSAITGLPIAQSPEMTQYQTKPESTLSRALTPPSVVGATARPSKAKLRIPAARSQSLSYFTAEDGTRMAYNPATGETSEIGKTRVPGSMTEGQKATNERMTKEAAARQERWKTEREDKKADSTNRVNQFKEQLKMQEKQFEAQSGNRANDTAYRDKKASYEAVRDARMVTLDTLKDAYDNATMPDPADSTKTIWDAPKQAGIAKQIDALAKQMVDDAEAFGGEQAKPLDQQTATAILQEVGGDKEKARALAKQRGYTF